MTTPDTDEQMEELRERFDQLRHVDLIARLRERADLLVHEGRTDGAFTSDLLTEAADVIAEHNGPQTFIVNWGRETSSDRFRHTFTSADDLVAALYEEVGERGPVLIDCVSKL